MSLNYFEIWQSNWNELYWTVWMWGVPSVEWAVGRSVKCWKRDGACNFKLKIGDMRHGEVRRIRWAQLKKGGRWSIRCRHIQPHRFLLLFSWFWIFPKARKWKNGKVAVPPTFLLPFPPSTSSVYLTLILLCDPPLFRLTRHWNVFSVSFQSAPNFADTRLTWSTQKNGREKSIDGGLDFLLCCLLFSIFFHVFPLGSPLSD